MLPQRNYWQELADAALEAGFITQAEIDHAFPPPSKEQTPIVVFCSSRHPEGGTSKKRSFYAAACARCQSSIPSFLMIATTAFSGPRRAANGPYRAFHTASFRTSVQAAWLRTLRMRAGPWWVI